MRRPLVVVLFGIGILLLGSPASAQTPDSFTPAVEEACTKYEGEGARHGLCIAYCEAQDCEATKFSNPSCATIEERFIAYSVKQGFVGLPKKGELPAIDCKVVVCSKDDVAFCGGKEIDCSIDGVCSPICTATFEGFSSKGDPLCSLAPLCKQCVGSKPGQ